ncbi:hypothetical protein [Flavobacterium sp.]|uniref:hypothetical protein n=1 Tax=Flavobacterium sp. TaxID=239 RepID=UPI00375346AE
MKNSLQIIAKSIVLFSIFFSLISAQAQAPRKFSYQAVIRNASNALVANTNVGIRVSILQGSETGNASYVETHTTTTNSNGLVNLQIGGGTLEGGSFTNINWKSGIYFIKTETDINGGTNFNIVGTSQLLSVPYALSSADNRWAANPNGINNIDGNVGIGTNVPNYKLHVGNSDNAMRIEGPATSGGRALSIGGYGNIEVDAPGLPGRRFTIQDNGNVGIGLAIPTTKLEVNGFTKLGTDAPAIKVMKITGTTAATEGGVMNFNHGLDSAKILSISVFVNYYLNNYVPTSYNSTGYECNYYLLGSFLALINKPANSNAILSKPVRILITYEE